MNTPSLQAITAVEDRYGPPNYERSLGEAFALLKTRWANGGRDRDTALRLAFLAWYARAEPSFLTGLPDEEDTPAIFADAFTVLGGTSSSDPEVWFVMSHMTGLFSWCLGDETHWAAIGQKFIEKVRLFAPNGPDLSWFSGKGAYGSYFGHIFARFGQHTGDWWST